MPLTTRRLAIAALPLVLLGSACAGSASAPPAAAARKSAPPIYDPNTLGEKEIAWKKMVCQQSNRRLFVNLGTNDCDLCRVVNDAMNEEKFQRAFLRQFVPSYIDVTPGSPNAQLLKDWKIDPAKGLPAAAIFDEQGRLSEVTQDGELAREAKKGPEAVQLWIIEHFYKDQ